MKLVRILLWKRKLEEKVLSVTEENKIKLKFKIRDELRKIRKKLQTMEDKNIISSMKRRSPKIFNKRYKKKVRNMLLSRRTLLEALKLLRRTWKY